MLSMEVESKYESETKSKLVIFLRIIAEFRRKARRIECFNDTVTKQSHVHIVAMNSNSPASMAASFKVNCCLRECQLDKTVSMCRKRFWSKVKIVASEPVAAESANAEMLQNKVQQLRGEHA